MINEITIANAIEDYRFAINWGEIGEKKNPAGAGPFCRSLLACVGHLAGGAVRLAGCVHNTVDELAFA